MNQQTQTGYTVYVSRNGQQVVAKPVRTKRDAEREYRAQCAQWSVERGYETSLYVGNDLEMLASNWPAA